MICKRNRPGTTPQPKNGERNWNCNFGVEKMRWPSWSCRCRSLCIWFEEMILVRTNSPWRVLYGINFISLHPMWIESLMKSKKSMQKRRYLMKKGMKLVFAAGKRRDFWIWGRYRSYLEHTRNTSHNSIYIQQSNAIFEGCKRDVFFFEITGSFCVERQMIWEWYIPIGMTPGHIPIKKVL